MVKIKWIIKLRIDSAYVAIFDFATLYCLRTELRLVSSYAIALSFKCNISILHQILREISTQCKK